MGEHMRGTVDVPLISEQAGAFHATLVGHRLRYHGQGLAGTIAERRRLGTIGKIHDPTIIRHVLVPFYRDPVLCHRRVGGGGGRRRHNTGDSREREI